MEGRPGTLAWPESRPPEGEGLDSRRWSREELLPLSCPPLRAGDDSWPPPTLGQRPRAELEDTTGCYPPSLARGPPKDGGPSDCGLETPGSNLGPRRKCKDLRHSFTIPEGSRCPASTSGLSLPVIAWGGSPTQHSPGARGPAAAHSPTQPGAQEDPTCPDQEGWEDPVENGQDVMEDPTGEGREGREDPTRDGQEGQEDPAEDGREGQEDPTGEGQEDPTGEGQEDPTGEGQEDPTGGGWEGQEDPAEDGRDGQEDPACGDEPGQGRPVTRRLTYIIKSRGPSGCEGEGAGLLRGGPGAEAEPRPASGRLTSFAEQKQLKASRPGRGLAGWAGAGGLRPGPEWAQVQRRLGLKQEEIRARLQAREARLARRWQTLGRTAYSRLLKLAGRDAGPSRGPAQEDWAPGLCRDPVTGLQVQIGTLGLEEEETGPRGLGPNVCPDPGHGVLGAAETEEGQGADPGGGEWAQDETARLGQRTAQNDPNTSELKLPESGRQEAKDSEVSSPGQKLLDLGGRDSRLPTCQQEAAPRERRREAQREQLGRRRHIRTRPDRDCERNPGSTLATAEQQGLKLFKEPSTKSNRLILHNALTYCCLAGKVNEVQRGQVIEELVKCEHVQCLVLFRDLHCQFRALYSFSADTSEIQRLCGTGPRMIQMEMVQGLYKYNSDRKQFRLIPSRIMSPNVDALTIHGHLWAARKKANLGGERK